MTMLKSVRIPSRWNGGKATAEFKLGLGPCGRTVHTLFSEWSNGCYVIAQACTDGSTKKFFYPIHTLTGRIEEEYY